MADKKMEEEMEDICTLRGRTRGALEDGVGTSQCAGNANGNPTIQEVQVSGRFRLSDVGSDSCL